jgi:hypothetical protein
MENLASLLESLNDQDTEVRRKACFDIRFIEDIRAVDALSKMLKDREKIVVESAFASLTSIMQHYDIVYEDLMNDFPELEWGWYDWYIEGNDTSKKEGYLSLKAYNVLMNFFEDTANDPINEFLIRTVQDEISVFNHLLVRNFNWVFCGRFSEQFRVQDVMVLAVFFRRFEHTNKPYDDFVNFLIEIYEDNEALYDDEILSTVWLLLLEHGRMKYNEDFSIFNSTANFREPLYEFWKGGIEFLGLSFSRMNEPVAGIIIDEWLKQGGFSKNDLEYLSEFEGFDMICKEYYDVDIIITFREWQEDKLRESDDDDVD